MFILHQVCDALLLSPGWHKLTCLCLFVCFCAGCERYVRGWEVWSSHVRVWVDGALYQHPAGSERAAEAGPALWCDRAGGGEGVPRAQGCPSGLQRVLPTRIRHPKWQWTGSQHARGGMAKHIIIMHINGPINHWEGARSLVNTLPFKSFASVIFLFSKGALNYLKVTERNV